MSKRGSPYLRYAIWLAASSAVLHNPALKLYFQKKRDEEKPTWHPWATPAERWFPLFTLSRETTKPMCRIFQAEFQIDKYIAGLHKIERST